MMKSKYLSQITRLKQIERSTKLDAENGIVALIISVGCVPILHGLEKAFFLNSSSQNEDVHLKVTPSSLNSLNTNSSVNCSNSALNDSYSLIST